MKLLLCCLLLLVLAPFATADKDWSAMNKDELFRECICWDQKTDSFCGGEKFWRSSCEHLALRTALWTIPAIMVGLFFGFFPFVFLICRYLCNCCGGRNPSYGACCPYSKTQVGESPRRYSNRSIFLVKFLATACFAAYIYYAVAIYTTNHKVHDSTRNLIDNIDSFCLQMKSDIVEAAQTAVILKKEKLITDPHLRQLQDYERVYSSRVNTIHDALGHVKDSESHQQYGRQQLSYALTSYPLFFMLFIFLFMLCNVRGLTTAILMSLFSISSCGLVALLCVHAVLAQASLIGCDNFNQAVAPTVRNVIEGKQGCNQEPVMKALNSTAILFVTRVCHDHKLAEFCGLTFNCSTRDLCETPFNATNYGLLNEKYFATVLESPAYNSSLCTFPNKMGALLHDCTIAACAKYCEGDAQHTAKQLVDDFSIYGPNITAMSSRILGNTRDCYFVMKSMNTTIRDGLCGDFKDRYTTASVVYISLVSIALISVFVFVSGTKRFTKMESVSEASGNLYPNNFVYGILVNENERAIVGAPVEEECRQDEQDFAGERTGLVNKPAAGWTHGV